MGPKKDKAKAADPKGGGEGGDPGENPATLLTNYTKFCKQINITANAKLVKTFTDEEALEEFMRVRARAHPPLVSLVRAAAAARRPLARGGALTRARAPPPPAPLRAVAPDRDRRRVRAARRGRHARAVHGHHGHGRGHDPCLLYTSPSPRD